MVLQWKILQRVFFLVHVSLVKLTLNILYFKKTLLIKVTLNKEGTCGLLIIYCYIVLEFIIPVIFLLFSDFSLGHIFVFQGF